MASVRGFWLLAALLDMLLPVLLSVIRLRNPTEKKLQHEIETGVIYWFKGVRVYEVGFFLLVSECM